MNCTKKKPSDMSTTHIFLAFSQSLWSSYSINLNLTLFPRTWKTRKPFHRAYHWANYESDIGTTGHETKFLGPPYLSPCHFPPHHAGPFHPWVLHDHNLGSVNTKVRFSLFLWNLVLFIQNADFRLYSLTIKKKKKLTVHPLTLRMNSWVVS